MALTRKKRQAGPAEEKIIAAAGRLFTIKGYAATKTRDIAAEAGINLALLNYYFKSKEKLFEMIVKENMNQFMQGIIGIIDNPDTTLRNKIELLVTHYIDMLLRFPDMPLFVLNHLKKIPQRHTMRERMKNSVFIKQLRRGIKDGEIASVSPPHILLNIVGLTIFPFVARGIFMDNGEITPALFNTLMQERKKLIPLWVEALLKVNPVRTKAITMKKTKISVILILLSILSRAQEPLNIDTCYARAMKQYPLIRQMELVDKTRDYIISNTRKGYFPQLSFNGQATYQSAVTSIVVPPRFGLSIPTPDKDQFNLHGEINQVVYDGGVIKSQSMLQEADAGAHQQNIQVELYALRDRINQLFFGVLLIDAQLGQNKLMQKDIQSSLEKMQAALTYGTALRSNLDELEAGLLQQEENELQLRASRKGYLDMLGLFLGKELNENTVLISPPPAQVSAILKRPEMAWYDIQKKNYDAQDKVLNANNRPRLSLFIQGGYARPGLNAFDTQVEPYYIGGVRLSWSLGGFYTVKNSRQILTLGRQTLDIEKEIFIFNTNVTLRQQSSEMVKLQQMVNKDEEIIRKRTAVKNAAKVQMDNGVITIHDFISELDAEDQARQNLLLHQVQLLMARYNYQYTSGN